MTKANKLSKKKRLNVEDRSVIEDKLQEEYRKFCSKEVEQSNNQFKLENRCIDCYEEMKEYILNCGLMVGQNLNCQNLLNFVKGEKKERDFKVYKDFKLRLVSIKKNSSINRKTF
jgi:hypothetical protein